MMRNWRVRMSWRDARGSFEAGADAAFPEVARWRGVDLAACWSVEAEHDGHTWERPDAPQETATP